MRVAAVVRPSSRTLIRWETLRREALIAFDVVKNLVVRRPFGSIRINYLVATPRLYPGATLVLRDGTVVRRGDRIARLDVKVFLPRLEGSEVRYVRALLPELAAELEVLAQLAVRDPRLRTVRAFVGQSHLVGRTSERLGLETRPIRSLPLRLFTDLGGRVAMVIVNPTWRGVCKSIKGPVRASREGWISRESLLRRFAPALAETR